MQACVHYIGTCLLRLTQLHAYDYPTGLVLKGGVNLAARNHIPRPEGLLRHKEFGKLC